MLLRELGGDCAGAILLLPEPELPDQDQCAYQLINDKDLADLIRQIPVRPLLAGEQGVRICLAGAQEKLALYEKDDRFYNR